MMHNVLTQRLIGAAVLVSLAVIFLPVFLGGDGDMGGLIMRTNVPPEPQYDFMVEPKDEVAALVNEVEAHTSTKIVEEDVDVDAAKSVASPADASKSAAAEGPSAAPVAPPNALDSEDKATTGARDRGPALQPRSLTVPAWVVQVASISDKKRALALRDELRQHKFVAYVESVTIKNTLSYRVRVGPEASRDQARGIQKEIKERMQLNAIVVRH